MATITPNPKFQAIDANGQPIVGGKLYTYEAGTTTPLPTYTNQSGLVANTNPVILDSSGSASVWLSTQPYKFVLKDSTDVEIWVLDYLNAPDQTVLAALANSTGSSLIGFIQAGSGAVARTVQSKLRDAISVTDFGAVGDGVTDDTTAIQNALTLAGSGAGNTNKVVVPPGAYNFTQLTMADANVELHLELGASIRPQVALQKAIIVTGDNCAITGLGSITSPAVFDAANMRTTYSTIWVEDCLGFRADGISLINVPRAGIYFEDATQAMITNIVIEGGYPYSSYNEATTVGQQGIGYNPPPTTYGWDYSLVIEGCRISGCVQGFIPANYDNTALTTGIVVTGNSFYNCWDHGIYVTLGDGVVVTGNNFRDCRRAIVMDGRNGVVVGNSLYSVDTGQLNFEVGISVRNAYNATITGNTLRGVGAFIDCSVYTTSGATEIYGNVISNNTLWQTAPSAYIQSAIRMGSFATLCMANNISNNFVYSQTPGTDGVISLSCTSTTSPVVGINNTLQNNIAIITAANYGLVATDMYDLTVNNNTFSFQCNAAVSTTVIGMLFGDCTKSLVANNNINFVVGGTNITFQGINALASSSDMSIRNNTMDLSAITMAGSNYYVVNSGTNINFDGNQYSITAPLTGTVSWPVGQASFDVNNVNCLSTSTIFISPKNIAGAQIQANPGVFVVAVDGRFTVATSSGIAGAGDWYWEIRG